MSGHSKWSTIKRKKGVQDAKRGAIFSKLARLIEVSARSGGDPEMNFKLKLAIQKAREANMPGSNIEKAISKGSGANKDDNLIEEVSYEGLAPGNIALVIEVVTDNKNRTVAELRNIFNKSGGTFGTQVAWQFDAKGVLQVAKATDQEAQELMIIDAGASDFIDAGEVIEVLTPPKELDTVRAKLVAAGLIIKSTSLELVPKTKTIITDLALAKRVLNFLDALEEHEDVVNIYSTFEIPDELLTQIN